MNKQSERIILPSSIKEVIGWDERTPIEIWIDGSGEQIVLKKHENRCIFCSKTRGLKEYKEKHICSNCIIAITGI